MSSMNAASPVSLSLSDPIAAPRVSVVIPAYNAQRYLFEAMESVLTQTYRNFEVIVVDDGSTDRTPQIIDSLAAHDRRVRRLTIPHGGIVKGLNAGVQAARGEYIARTDADDLCVPDRFERQVRYLDDHPDCVLVGSKVTLVDPYNSTLWDVEVKADHDGIEGELLNGNGWAVIHPSAMLRKSAVMEAGGYRPEYEWVEDLDLFLRMAQFGRLANLQDSMLRYRQHYGSVNRNKLDTQIQRTGKAVAEAYQRRGRTAPAEFTPKVGTTMSRQEQTRAWCLQALFTRNYFAARRHALAIIRAEPLRVDSWKMMLHALAGR
ncbi:MAG TPA: glycosyltransferase family A protein [Tepidisphaeraceae bacterium]